MVPACGKNGDDGVFKAHWPQPVDGGEPGGKSLYHDVWQTGNNGSVYVRERGCEVAYGVPGGDAKSGGNAGKGGCAGNGGSGGTVVMRWMIVPHVEPTCSVKAAPAGEPGADGSVGGHGRFGTGGRNRVFWYERIGEGDAQTGEAYAGEASAIAQFGEFGCAVPAPAAANGQPSDKSGTKPDRSKERAVNGRDGSIDLGHTSAADYCVHAGPAYLDAIRRWADDDTRRGMEAVQRGYDIGAAEIWQEGLGALNAARLHLEWLMRLTSGGAQPEVHERAGKDLETVRAFYKAHASFPGAAAA